ncbi:hypothetical protein V6N13_032503 [Hibiscus sabdariffa]
MWREIDESISRRVRDVGRSLCVIFLLNYTGKWKGLWNWNWTCRPRKFSGLGVVNLRHRHLALVAKWDWRFVTKKATLWRSIITTKYGEAALHWRFSLTYQCHMFVV